MGHNIMYSTYPENVNRKSVQAEWDDYVAHEDWQEGASGLVNPIEWHNITFNNEEDAREWIDNHDKGWYRQIAVKYKQYKNSNCPQHCTEPLCNSFHALRNNIIISHQHHYNHQHNQPHDGGLLKILLERLKISSGNITFLVTHHL